MPVKPLIPNAETRKAIADGRARKGVTVHKSAAAWRNTLLAVSAKERKAEATDLTVKTEAELPKKV